jgi:hypothetical protein
MIGLSEFNQRLTETDRLSLRQFWKEHWGDEKKTLNHKF